MSADIDQPPVYDPLTKRSSDYLSDVWVSYMSTLIQTLIGYLTQYGILIPQMTTAQRNTIQSPVNGQMIYNTTLNSAQYWQNGTWVSF